MTLLDPAPGTTGAAPQRPVPASPRRGPGRVRPSSHLRLVTESALLGLVVGALVVAPWVAGGHLLLLDWVSGPHDTVDPGVFGLTYAGMDALPWRLLTTAAQHLLGPAVTGWLFVLLPFPIAAAGAAHLVAGRRLPSYAAALAVTCTPFVADRVGAGHTGFLLAVALLPWLAASALHAQRRRRWFSARVAGWYALAMAVSPHAAWIGGALLVAVTLSSRPTVRDVVRLVATLAAAATVYAYAVVVLLVDTPPVSVSSADLEAFATLEGPGGLLPTVLTLHGFWRGGPGQVRDVLGPVSALLALVLLGTVVAGIAMLVRAREPLGRLAVVLVGVGALLSLGTLAPTGDLYALAFERLPLFAVMREPAKWLALVQLGYAIGLAAGVAQVESWARRRRTTAGSRIPLAAPVVLSLAPLLMLPALAWGMGGRIATSAYPESWGQVERITAGTPGALLALPWHGYQPYAFTAWRSVASPVSAALSTTVLQSDAVELGPLRTNSTSERQRTVDRWVASGGTAASPVRELGVAWILLARGSENSAYSWVARQPGLDLVLRTDDVELWAVRDAAATTARLRHASQAHYVVEPGTPGRVVLPEEYADGWTLDGRPGQRTGSGAVAFDVGADRADIVYAPWESLRVGVLVSLAALLALLVAGLVEHRHDVPFGRRVRTRTTRTVTS